MCIISSVFTTSILYFQSRTKLRDIAGRDAKHYLPIKKDPSKFYQYQGGIVDRYFRFADIYCQKSVGTTEL